MIVIAVCATYVPQAAPADQVPQTCQVTKAPRQVFVPPPPHDPLPPDNTFYFGSNDLWVFLPNNGVWDTLRDGANYDRRKIAWFSKSYWWLSQQERDLVVDSKPLDRVAEAVHAGGATNSFVPEQQTSAMLNSIEFSSTGCWEITARYRDHELKFVVSVMPYTASSN